MYHRVAEESFDPWGLAVSPGRFAQQLAWLRRHRLILSLHAFTALHRAGKLPAKAIAITFDDGYACNAQVAAPLLERAGAPATIFLPVDLIEAGREFWWDELERIVLNHPAASIDLETQEGTRSIALGPRHVDDRSWRPHQPPRTARQHDFHLSWSMIRVLNSADQRRAMESLRRQAALTDAPRDTHRPLTLAEARSVQSDQIDMGSHSLTHASLTHCSPEERAAEILESRSRCAAITGRPPASFAYPYGDYDSQAVRLVAQAGYACACTTRPSSVARSDDLHALPRIQVEDWDAGTLASVLRAA